MHASDAIVTFLSHLSFWHWWIVGVAFLVFEMLAPGVAFLWLAIAAGITGLFVLVRPGSAWQVQIVVFAVLSVISMVAGRLYVKRHPTESDRPTLNQRGHQYVGRRFVLSEAISNGVGKIRVDDTTWRVAGPDLPNGTNVVVTGVDGSSLIVEKADPAGG